MLPAIVQGQIIILMCNAPLYQLKTKARLKLYKVVYIMTNH